MRIAKKQGFLTLQSDPPQPKSIVAIADNLSAVIQSWTSGTRVSPIWGLGGTGPTRHKFEGTNHLLFVGPVSPARLFAEVDLRRRPGNLNTWLSLGTFNIILRVDDADEGLAAIGDVSKWAGKHETPFERWTVKDGVLSRWHATPINLPRATSAFKALAKLARQDFRNGLNIHAQEFLVLMASALSRSATIDKNLHSDLVQVAEEVALDISDAMSKPEQILDVSAELININAALSRFTSQAFSGISPISSTECHFWIHSLLGTGSANIALANLVKFITSRLGRANLPERFVALKHVTQNVPNYARLVSDDEFLWRDHIGDIMRWSRLSEQIFRVDKWSLCRS